MVACPTFIESSRLARIPAHRHFLADLQRVLAPALTEQRVRRPAFDAIDDRLAVGRLRFDRRIDVRVRPVDLLDRALECDRLARVELRRDRVMRPRRGRHQPASRRRRRTGPRLYVPLKFLPAFQMTDPLSNSRPPVGSTRLIAPLRMLSRLFSSHEYSMMTSRAGLMPPGADVHPVLRVGLRVVHRDRVLDRVRVGPHEGVGHASVPCCADGPPCRASCSR